MIRTLVVDDSKFMRTLIADMLVSDPKIDVIATAKEGEDAVAKARLYHPDVITLEKLQLISDAWIGSPRFIRYGKRLGECLGD